MRSGRTVIASAARKLVWAVLAVLASCGTGGDAGSRLWNVLIVAPDTVRGDHLALNGYARPTSPALDALAAEGVNFSRATTVAPRTWQSFSSILTGVYPPTHGVRFIYDEPIAEGVPTIAELLRQHSYRTAAFEGRPGAYGFLRSMTGGRSFEEYRGAVPKKAHRSDGHALLDETFDWMTRHRDEGSLLAFVRTRGGHWPYIVTEWLDKDHDCSGYDHSFNSGNHGLELIKGGKRGFRLENEDVRRRMIWTVDPDERTRSHRIAHYDAQLRETDYIVGELVERMRKSGLLEETIVLVTSDHGESFGEHGYMQHGPRVDEPVMHVPLILRLPEGHPERRPGLRIDAQVRVVDILPTLLELVGVPVPDSIEGTSLVPLMRGKSDEELWAYGESGRSFNLDPQRYMPGVPGKHRMLRTERWKLVMLPTDKGAFYRLYDLENDPGEERDVAGQRPDVVRELRAELDKIVQADHRTRPDRALTDAQEATLRSLGYLE